MTAINVLRQHNAVHILSDGAVYSDSGVMMHASPKAFALPHINAAIAARGSLIGLTLMATAFATVSTYGDLKGAAVDILREAIEMTRTLTTQSAYGDDLQIFVAGWSDAGPDAYTILTRPDGGVPAWKVVPIAEQSFAPFENGGPVHHDIWDIFGGRTVDSLDPRLDGLRILEAQRRRKMKLPDGRHVFGVGGFAQLTTVRRDAISTEILHRWPDEIGEQIRPEYVA